MSILSDHQDAAIWKYWKHDHRSRMRYDLAGNLHPTGFEHGLAPNAEDASFEHNFAANDLSQRFFLGHAISYHANMTTLFYSAIAPCAILAARRNAPRYLRRSRFLAAIVTVSFTNQ